MMHSIAAIAYFKVICFSPAKTEGNDKYCADMTATHQCMCEIRRLMSTPPEVFIKKHVQKAK